MIEFDERGNEVVFGDAVEKNTVCAGVRVPSRVWSLSASLGTKDGRNPSYPVRAWSHTILFFLLNSDSTCIRRSVGVSGRLPLRQREMLCVRNVIRVGSDLILIPHITSFFLRFPTYCPFFCI